MWLPAALGAHAWQQAGQSVQVQIRHVDGTHGELSLKWRVEAPRQIALVRIPRLWVSFAFEGLSEAQRYTFMRRFDLYMQRGGG